VTKISRLFLFTNARKDEKKRSFLFFENAVGVFPFYFVVFFAILFSNVGVFPFYFVVFFAILFYFVVFFAILFSKKYIY
jgi:hypothetical protein